MRKFGNFIDEDDGDDGVQPPVSIIPEISTIDYVKLANEAETPVEPAITKPSYSTINQNAAVQPAAIPPAAPPAPVVNKPSPGANFKPGHRPAPAPGKARHRYAWHEPFNSLVRTDWQRAIEDDPYAFDGLLYLPSIAEVPQESRADFEHPEYTEINNNQRELTYGTPHPVVILDCPDERENFFALDADGEQDGYADEYLVLRIAATGIPIGSVIEWREEQADGSAPLRWWYVMKIFAYGTAAVGSLYFCVPARNFEGSQEK